MTAAVRRLRTVLPIALAVIVLMLSGTAADGVRAGLALCIQSVIPALFPFLVLSPMLVFSLQMLLGRLCGSWTDARISALLSAFAVGMTAGFPIGAVTLASLCRQGTVTKADAKRFLGVCTGASPAFLIGYVGRALWDSALLGLVLWCEQVLFCFIGFWTAWKRSSAGEGQIAVMTAQQMPRLSACLREAVTRTAGICGAIVFFTVIRAYLCCLLPTAAAAVIGGIAEMTGGLRECAVLYECGAFDRAAALVISAAMIGFGGLCVGMQTADAALFEGISMRHYWMQRVMLGTAMGLSAAVLCVVCGW